MRKCSHWIGLWLAYGAFSPLIDVVDCGWHLVVESFLGLPGRNLTLGHDKEVSSGRNLILG